MMTQGVAQVNWCTHQRLASRQADPVLRGWLLLIGGAEFSSLQK